MKKSIIICLALAALLCTGCAEADKADDTTAEISDTTSATETKDITDDSGNVIGKSYFEGGYLAKEEFFAEDGTVSSANFYENGVLKVSETYKYNADKVMTVCTAKEYDGEELITETRYSVAEDGTRTEANVTKYERNSDGSFKKTVYSGDAIIEESSYDASGKPTCVTNFDKKGSTADFYEGNKLSKTETYNSDNELIGTADYTYDENGNAVLTVTKDKDGNETLRSEAEYNENGRRTKVTTKNADGVILSIAVYDENGSATVYTEQEYYANFGW